MEKKKYRLTIKETKGSKFIRQWDEEIESSKRPSVGESLKTLTTIPLIKTIIRVLEIK